MQLFFSPDIIGDRYIMNEDESQHCVRVLRKHQGDVVKLIDGKGGLYTAEITLASPKACEVVIVEHLKGYEKRPYRLHIAAAPTKNIDRWEWLLEKCTEIGVDRITPLLTDHSERDRVKLERNMKIVVSAIKQSIKAYCPVVDEMIPFKKFMTSDFGTSQLFIGHCEHDKPKVLLRDAVSRHGDAVVLIGPEGDFSLDEIEIAHSKGFADMTLGESRLRSETAAVMTAAIVSTINM